MGYRVEQVGALEIPNSRGRPTLEVTIRLADGSVGTAGAPSRAPARGERVVKYNRLAAIASAVPAAPFGLVG